MKPATKIKAAKAVFRANGLSKVYRMGEIEVSALRSLDLELYEGEFVVLLGAIGQRQVYAAEHSRRTRRADER